MESLDYLNKVINLNELEVVSEVAGQDAIYSDSQLMKAIDELKGISEKSSEECKCSCEKKLFNLKFDYEALLKYTVDLITHEQHVKFAAKKKEIFG